MSYLTHAQRYDVLCVGDVATDVFITVPPERVREREEDGQRLLLVPLGAKVPFEHEVTVAAGGSAANVAVAMGRLGLRVALASFLAHDEVGRDLFSALHVEHVDTRLMHVDSPARTNRNFVLSYRGERTIFVRHEDFGYHWPHLRPSEVPAWLHLASLGRGALGYQDQIADWLEENPAVRLAFQPGTFQIEAGVERLVRLYARADLLVCSLAEGAAIAGCAPTDPGAVLDQLAKLGNAEIVLVDMSGGAVAQLRDGRYRVPAFPDSSPPLDRTGGEDAFVAALLAAVVHAVPLPEALLWGPVNFMSVSHELGSQRGLLHLGELQADLEEARPDYRLERV